MPTLRCPWSDVVFETDSTKVVESPSKEIATRRERATMSHSLVVDAGGRAIPDPNVKYVASADTPTTDPGRDALISDLRARLQALEDKEKQSDVPKIVPATPATPTLTPGPIPVE